MRDGCVTEGFEPIMNTLVSRCLRRGIVQMDNDANRVAPPAGQHPRLGSLDGVRQLQAGLLGLSVAVIHDTTAAPRAYPLRYARKRLFVSLF